MDSAMTVPPVSVPWLKLDSYETVESSKAKITASFLGDDELNDDPTPSSSSLMVIDSKNYNLEVLMDEGIWDLGDVFDINSTLNQKTSTYIGRLKEDCADASYPVPKSFLYIVDLAETAVVATAYIKDHVVDNLTLVQKFVYTTEALPNSLAEK